MSAVFRMANMVYAAIHRRRDAVSKQWGKWRLKVVLWHPHTCVHLHPPHIKVWMVSYFCKESLSAYFRPLWPCSVCIIYNQLCHCGHKAIMDSKQASEHSSKLYWQEQTASNVAWTLSTLNWKIGYFSDFIQEHTVMNSVLHEPNQYTGHWSDSSRLS